MPSLLYKVVRQANDRSTMLGIMQQWWENVIKTSANQKEEVDRFFKIISKIGRYKRYDFFCCATVLGILPIVIQFINDKKTEVNRYNNIDFTPLLIACKYNHAEIAARLLADPRVDVNMTRVTGETPLYTACFLGHDKIIPLLLAHPQIQVNSKRTGNLTALYAACYIGHTEVVAQLLADPRVDVNQATDNGSTALMAACGRGHTQIVAQLLACPRIDVSIASDSKETALSMACSNGHAAIVKLLLAHPSVNANQPAYNDLPPFMIACGLGHTHVVSQFLAHLSIEDILQHKDGKTALEYAIQGRSPAVTALLLKDQRIANDAINKPGIMSALFQFVQENDTDHDLLQAWKTMLKTGCLSQEISEQQLQYLGLDTKEIEQFQNEYLTQFLETDLYPSPTPQTEQQKESSQTILTLG